MPEGTFCVRCGARLEAGRRRGFSAAPHEGIRRPSIVSSIFPQLPRASLLTFRVALAFGVAVVLVLAVLKLFPLAIVASAILVPLLTVLYLYDVDVYEDEPLFVVGATMLWGAVAGVGFGLLAKQVSPADASLLTSSGSTAVLRGVVLPLASVVLMLAGPLVLLPYRKFNDVLDGATFGGACAVTFAGAVVLTQAFDLFGDGLRPGGSVGSWVVRLLELAVAAPVLAAALIGAVAGAFWLRYRAPVRDRNALGPAGRPAVAVTLAAGVLVGSALGELYLPQLGSLALYVILDVVALVWLRQVIHVGLLEEAAEITIGEPFTCANCGEQTPRHSFCSSCGISILALPKRREPSAGGPSAAAASEGAT